MRQRTFTGLEIEPRTLEQLRALARDDDRTVSAELRRAIRAHLNKMSPAPVVGEPGLKIAGERDHVAER